MSHLQFLNVFLTERLTAVAMEISVVLEQKIGEYQVEISRSNEENKRLQRLLNLVFSSESKLHREDSQQLSLPVSEQVPPEQQHCQQDWSPSLEQEDPEPTQIKEEQEEFRTSQEEDQPQGLEPDTKDLLIPACVKSDYEQDPPLPSHLDQTLGNRERDSQPTYTTEQIKTEPDGVDYRGSEPTRDSQLLSEGQIEDRVDWVERPILPPFSPDSQQPSLPVSKEEVPPEQQEGSPSLGLDDPEPTKQEELWTNQEEQQLESDSSVSEPTSNSQLLSAVNPDCSAAPGENRKCVDGAVDMLILLFFPPDSQQLSLPVSEEEVPPEQQHCQQERSPSLGQEDPEPTQIKEEQEELRTSQDEDQPQGLESEIRVSEPTSLRKILDSTSVANPDCSAAQSEKIEEYVDGLERPILPSYPPELPVSKEEVPSEQQERSPSLGLDDPEPTKQEELWTNQEEQQLESASRVSEPTSLCKILDSTSVANPDCSAAQSEKIEEYVDGLERPILPSYPPELPVSKEEVPSEQQERSPSLGLDDPEPTKQEELWTNQEEQQLESASRVSEPTSLCKILDSTSVANPDCSAAQSEKIEEYVDGLERPILPSYPPELPVSKEEVPSEQQERSPSLGLDDPEPTKQEELWTNQEEQQLESASRVSEPTSLCKILDSTSVANPDCSAAQSEKIEEYVDGLERPILPSYPPELPVPKEEVPSEQQERSPSLGLDDPEPTKQEELWTNQEEQQLESASRVSEPTSLCKILDSTSVANPDCSAAQSEKIEEYVDGLERPILPSYPPELPVSKEEVPSEQQERSPSLGLDDPEPTKQEELWTNQEEQQLESASRVSEPTSLCKILDSTSVANPDCSAAQSEKIEEYVDGLERPILPSYPPELPVSKEEVPSEQQERSPSLGLDDPEPTKQEELWTNQEEQQLESASRVSESTSDSQLLSAVNPDCSAAQSENRVSEPTSDSQLLSAVNPDCSAAQSENRKVHQSPSTSSEQDSSNVESNEASNFCTWSDENIPVTDRNSSDSSSCTKEDSEARKPAKRTCHSSGVVNEPSDMTNLCDENNPGTEIIPSDSNKDMNIQTDSGAHNPAKRICQRVHNVAVARRGSGEMVSCSRPKAPGSTPDYTHCMHCQGLYIQKSLWKHVRYCPLNPKAEEPKPGQKMRIQSAMAFQLCSQPDYVSTGLWKIVCGMNPSQVSFVVRNDKYILLMGEEMYNKLQPDDRRNKNIQQRMREVARLLITARTCTPLMCFEDLVIPSNLPHVITAVRAVAGYNEENKTYDRPTLAVQMGYSLMNIGSAVESFALKSGQHKVAESAGKFKSFKWNEVVLAGALSTLSEPKKKCAQPTHHTGAQPADPSHRRPASRPVTQAPSLPNPVTQVPGQLTSVAQAPGQPTSVTQAPSQPTSVTQAPSQTTRRTRAQPIRRTRTQPTRHTSAQPTQRHTVRLKWTIDEVAAVEKHMMSFIKSGRVPGKRDCLKCLQSESVALKSRSWSGIKFYVNNRLKRR